MTHQKLINFSRQQEEPLVLLGTAVALAGCCVLCAVNPQLLNNITLQSLTSATFAVGGALLYILYMVISKMVALVLLYIESHQRHTLLLSEDERRLMEDDTSELSHDDNDNNNNNNSNNGNSSSNNNARMPREAVISSMYLGGSGVFLSIPPLCVWDISISASFTLSLLAIAFMDGGKVATEFRANVDTAAAVINLKRLRMLHQGAILGMLLCMLWMDAQDRSFFDGAPSSQGQQWPLVLLAASSPFLLRGGGGRLRGMSPSQTLETALPVCALLAILVLCWYGPLEKVLLSHTSFPLATALPMLLLCPPCLSAALAFILHSLRCRHAAVSATLLTLTIFIRQQILAQHHMRSASDWLALGSMLNLLMLSGGFWLYRHRVIWTPSPPLVVADEIVVATAIPEDKSIEDLQR